MWFVWVCDCSAVVYFLGESGSNKEVIERSTHNIVELRWILHKAWNCWANTGDRKRENKKKREQWISEVMLSQGILLFLSFCLQCLLIQTQLLIARENRTSSNKSAINMDHCPCLWLHCKVSASRYLSPLSMSRQSFNSAEDMIRSEKSMWVTGRTGECHNS